MRAFKSTLIIISVFLLIMGGILIGWANWPSSNRTRSIDLHLIASGDWDAEDAAVINQRTFTLKLTYPELIKTGQIAHYQIIVDRLPAVISVNNVEYQLRLRCQLLLPGFDNQQTGMSIQGVQDQVPIRFSWDLQTLADRKAEGVLRLFVDYVSPDNNVTPQLISITELSLTSISLLGLSTTHATSLAVAFVLLSGVMGGLGLTKPRSD